MVRVRKSDKINGKPIIESILSFAQEHHIAGSSVWQCIGGYGDHGDYRLNILRMTPDLPVIIEIVDEPHIIQQFLPKLSKLVKNNGLITVSEMESFLYVDSHINNKNAFDSKIIMINILKLVTNVKTMSNRLTNLFNDRFNQETIESFNNLEIENNSVSQELLNLNTIDLFLPVKSGHFNRLIYSLIGISDLITGIARRMTIGREYFSLEFTNHANLMLNLVSQASTLIVEQTITLEKEDSFDREGIIKIKEIETEGDKLHNAFLDVFYKTTNANIQEKDLDQFFENLLDELYIAYVYLQVFGSDYLSLKEERFYLP